MSLIEELPTVPSRTADGQWTAAAQVAWQLAEYLKTTGTIPYLWHVDAEMYSALQRELSHPQDCGAQDVHVPGVKILPALPVS